jgi:hypothetical protein
LLRSQRAPSGKLGEAHLRDISAPSPNACSVSFTGRAASANP